MQSPEEHGPSSHEQDADVFVPFSLLSGVALNFFLLIVIFCKAAVMLIQCEFWWLQTSI